MKTVGLIVNPIAGMGGSVGLKGTDGASVLRQAIERGATPRSQSRTAVALAGLSPLRDVVRIVTFPGDMGENAARAAGFSPEVLLKDEIDPTTTTRNDTIRAAGAILRRGVDLLLFAGGDGTARDICGVVGTDVVSLGIPAGVKIHSAVFGCSPRESGDVARQFLEDPATETRASEVMDIDEELFREGSVQARLHGFLCVPYVRQRVQGLKAGSALSEESVQRTIAGYVVRELMEPETLYVIGPGATTMALKDRLGLDGTLLGVDAALGGKMAGKDLTEALLLDLCDAHERRKLVMTPIGGQGFLFGRGNQQISARVLRFFDPSDLLVLCTPAKLCALEGSPMLVDTGDPGIDAKYSGYIRCVTGNGQYAMYRVR